MSYNLVDRLSPMCADAMPQLGSVSESSLNPCWFSNSHDLLPPLLLSLPHKAKPKPTATDLPPTSVKSKEIQEIVNELHVKIGKLEHRVVVYLDRATSRESWGTMNGRYETASFVSGNGAGGVASRLEGEQQHGQISNKKCKEIFPYGNHKSY
ncbi:hypothetical protein ACFX15_031148 [Malus domestica]